MNENFIKEIDLAPLYNPKDSFVRYLSNSNPMIVSLANSALDALNEIDTIRNENAYQLKRGPGVSYTAVFATIDIDALQAKVDQSSIKIGQIEGA